MNQQELALAAAVSLAVGRVLDDLAPQQLAPFHLMVALEYDGRTLPFAETVRSLYTQEGGRSMHEVTRQEVLRQIAERLGL